MSDLDDEELRATRILNGSDSSYRSNVFNDLIRTLERSTEAHLKTKKDLQEGICLLVNFNNILNNYDEVIKILQKKDNER